MDNIQDKLDTMNEDQVSNLYKETFSKAEAQLVLEDLKNRCFIKTTPFTGTDSWTNFNSGMQAVVLHIEQQIKYKPETNSEEADV